MSNEKDGRGGGPRYEVNLDGDIREWPSPTITVAQIRELAGWADDQPIVMVNLETNEEVTLAEDATVELKPGHGFSKKVKFSPLYTERFADHVASAYTPIPSPGQQPGAQTPPGGTS